MAAPPPPNFPPDAGGVEAVGANTDELGIADVFTRQNNLLLQLAHYQREQIDAADPNRDQKLANLDLVRNNARRLQEAARHMTTREKSTRTLQPLTRLPAVEWGLNNDVAAIRLYSVKTFDGTPVDNREVHRWISRIISLAKTHQLTFAATITLMINASNGDALDFITELQDEGKSLADVIQGLELRYGDLCLPQEAVVRCNSMQRGANESLLDFLDRLRYMAKMAKREIENDADRRRAIDLIIESNIRRVLPTSVRVALEERILARTRSGLPPFKAREIEKECAELEKRREERLAEANDLGGKNKKIGVVRNVRAAPALLYQPSYDYERAEGPPSGQTSDDDDSDSSLEAIIAEVKYKQRQYLSKGKPFDKKRVFRKVLEKYQVPANHPKVVAALGGDRREAPSGPPVRMPEPYRKTIRELLDAANCTRGECIHCGAQGHLMRQDACALRGKPIVDRACPACKKGLHAADDCPRVFQKRSNYAQQVEEDSDDLND